MNTTWQSLPADQRAALGRLRPNARPGAAHLEVLPDRRCIAEVNGIVEPPFDSYSEAEAAMRARDLVFTVSRFPELSPLVLAESPTLPAA